MQHKTGNDKDEGTRGPNELASWHAVGLSV